MKKTYKLTKEKSMNRIILTFLILNFAACLDLGDSKNEVLQEVTNSNNTKKAIFFIKYTGATSDNSLQVSLKGADYKLTETEAGNVFTTDSDHGKVRLDSSTIKLKWVSDDTLSVRYNQKLRIFIQNKVFAKTVIEYESFKEVNSNDN